MWLSESAAEGTAAPGTGAAGGSAAAAMGAAAGPPASATSPASGGFLFLPSFGHDILT